MFGAIITNQTWVEGDKRSRTNPGHGYPAGYETRTEFREFKTEAEMIDWVKTQARYSAKYRIIKFEEIELEIKFTVKTKPVFRSSGAGHSPEC